jgi:LEA14-like dessication related protein
MSDVARLAAAGRACLLAALLSSCSLVQQLSFEKPTLRLTAVEITDIDLSGVAVVLWLEVFNPNDYDISTLRIDAELELEGTQFGNALLEESVVLAGASRTTVKIPAEFEWQGIGAGARALLQRGSLSYDLETRLRVKTSLGTRTVNLGNRGEVDVWN